MDSQPESGSMSELPPLHSVGPCSSVLLQLPRGRIRNNDPQRQFSSSRRSTSMDGDLTKMIESSSPNQIAVLGEDMRIYFSALDRKLDDLVMQIGAGLDNLSVQLSSGIHEIKAHEKRRVSEAQVGKPNGIDNGLLLAARSIFPYNGTVDPHSTSSTDEATPNIGGNAAVTADPIRERRTSFSSDSTRMSSDSVFAGAQLLIAKGASGQSELTQAVWRFLEDPDSSPAAAWYPRVWTVLIIAAVAVTMLQTLEDQVLTGREAEAISIGFDVLFTLEVLLRFCVSPGRCVFFRNPNNLIDILAALPVLLRGSCLLNVIECGDDSIPTTVLRCIVPSIQLLKILRHFEQFHLFFFLATETLDALVVLYFLLFFIVLSSASIVYMVEPRDNIGSVPIAMYLIIATVSTVGYGDITPDSTAGTFAVSLIIVTSVLFMAMPIGIVGNAFTQLWSDRDRILLTIRTRDRLTQWGYTAADMHMLFKHFDKNRSGDLNLKEFSTMMSELRIGIGEDRVCRLFESFDEDGSGSIDPMEFTKALFPSTYLELHSMTQTKSNEFAMLQQSENGLKVAPEGIPAQGTMHGDGVTRSSSKSSSRSSSKDRGRKTDSPNASNANGSKFKTF